MKKFLITLLKIALSVGIIAYLVVSAIRSKDGKDVFADMLAQPKQWDLLAGAWLCVAAATVLTLIRWCYLVRALGISFSIRDSLRIGFLGCLFNLAPMGIVGGDVLKAVMLARERPGNRAKAAASVVVDRVVGLYVMFLVATAGILLTGFWGQTAAMPRVQVTLFWLWPAVIIPVRFVCQAVFVLTGVGTVAMVALVVPGMTGGRWTAALARIPRIGPAIHSMLEAVRMYRHHVPVLVLSGIITIFVHTLGSIGLYLIARGFQVTALPLASYLAIYPTSAVAGTVPLPAGPTEGALVFFFKQVADLEPQGLVIALVFRLINILVATVGFCYYLGSRREVAEVMHEAETEPQDEAERDAVA